MTVTIRHGDCREVLRTLPDESVHCCVTSPPYFGLRDYGVAGQIGLEPTPDEFVAQMVAVFREVRRVLRSDGTVWLNLGDSYSTHAAGKIANPMAKSTLAGVKTQEVANASSRAQGAYRKDATLPEKNLMGIPWRVALALQADGWILRQDIIWSKPQPDA
jgi:DNA modification methylase